MAFVYRYLLPNNEEVVYIGKTSGDTIESLNKRISAHASEEKFKKCSPRSGYRIEYIDGLTPSDADILETALINENVFSYPKLNVSKCSWGKSGFVCTTDLQWKLYSPADFEKTSPFHKWMTSTNDHSDSVYSCEICGKEEKIGRFRGPRYVDLAVRAASGSYLGSLWLCDACSNNVGDALHAYICKLRSLNPLQKGANI